MAKKVIEPPAIRTPITIISTDWHLKESNKDQIKDLVRQKCKLAMELSVDTVFMLGDVFESRSGQKVEELVSLDEILDVFKEYNIKLVMIPGNHDKQNYDSPKSFLQPYKHHPALMLIDRAGGVPIRNYHFSLLPFFREKVWLERYQELLEYLGEFDKGIKHVLLSHIAMNGSVNNDGTKVECGISVTDFKQWNLVLLGHYHNQQQVGANVFHIPSIAQNNFGEDNQKGFTVVYDDGSFDLVTAKFKEYEKVSIDFDQTNRATLDLMIKEYANAAKFVRFEFTGSADRVKAIDKEELTALGIDVKIKVKEVEQTIEFATEEVKEYTKDSIVEEFAKFCEEKGHKYDEGIIHLNKKLEKCQ